jgi:hypothetical protein
MSSILKPGEAAAKKAEKQQRQAMAKQEVKEKARLAESTDEVARRKTMAGKGGRDSLIKTSQAGVQADTLGGV